jgi:hypothetical protein
VKNITPSDLENFKFFDVSKTAANAGKIKKRPKIAGPDPQVVPFEFNHKIDNKNKATPTPWSGKTFLEEVP